MAHGDRFHREEMNVEALQHLQGITGALRENQKEADRDLWEQRTTQYQTMMTVGATPRRARGGYNLFSKDGGIWG